MWPPACKKINVFQAAFLANGSQCLLEFAIFVAQILANVMRETVFQTLFVIFMKN